MPKTKPETPHMWTCPNCRRKFERQNQSHSCKPFPLPEHFKGKEEAKALYAVLRRETERRVGKLEVESLACCIHFVSTFTFAAVRVFASRLLVDFSLPHPVKHPRIEKCIKMSAHRYLCFVEVAAPGDVDEELLEWLREAHDIRQAADASGAHVGHGNAR
jgi:hypothetical protein